MTQNIIRIRCPNLLCGRVLGVPGHARGKRVKCRKCATIMMVPQKKAAPAPGDPEAAESEASADDVAA
ncbi:MAG: hypothetical protein AB8G96_02960 [Phycisphaerales bacterium]